MYKVEFSFSGTKSLGTNSYNIGTLELDLFLLSTRELYVLCVMLLIKNDCFYVKIKRLQMVRDGLVVFTYVMLAL